MKMKIHLLERREKTGWTEFGSCWDRGEVCTPWFEVKDGKGESIPSQSAVTARWPDGSVKWARHTVRADILGSCGTVTPCGKAVTGQPGLEIREEAGGWTVTGQRIHAIIPGEGDFLLRELSLDGCAMADCVWPVLSLAHESAVGEGSRTDVIPCPARITGRVLEEKGPLQAVFRLDGVHLENGREIMPFRIRLYLRDDGDLSFDHTFFFQGEPERDRLAAMGLRFSVPLCGKSYQRHIRYLTDQAVFHDCPTQLFHWKMRLDRELLAAQMRGETVPAAERLDEAAAGLARWNHFLLLQDSAQHYVIRKKTAEDVCWVEGPQGNRAPGTMAISDPERTLVFSVRDFWEKHPGGLEAEDVNGDRSTCTVWFWAPQAKPCDFRHYEHRMYVEGAYEGFDYVRPDPTGIAVTSSCSLHLTSSYPDNGALAEMNRAVRKPPVYVADPAYYHERQAFGFWGESREETETEHWIEEQIRLACDFYRSEVDARSWYGLFDYGDFMHTYEASRHCWRYDVGGYAWDNTELVPTYWLWLQFMRTGDETVFSLAEALSRHAADVDMCHFGPIAGLGSRHNVRHWGCSCKEPRVSMAGHHRPLYYLTGSRRIGDCMQDALQADETLIHTPYYSRESGMPVIRTGPDWSSLVSNWMTAYERTLDPGWLAKIEAGIDGISAAPLGLTSGPDFDFDPASGEMRYHGETDRTVNMHLQACMAGPEIWLETARMMESERLLNLVARNGRFFFLSPEQRIAESGGLLKNRGFGSVIYSADMQAWAVINCGEKDEASEIWRKLLALLYAPDRPEGFRPVAIPGTDGAAVEIPWISTNFTAQWCLKAIVCLDLIRNGLPETLSELDAWLEDKPAELPMYGA